MIWKCVICGRMSDELIPGTDMLHEDATEKSYRHPHWGDPDYDDSTAYDLGYRNIESIPFREDSSAWPAYYNGVLDRQGEHDLLHLDINDNDSSDI